MNLKEKIATWFKKPDASAPQPLREKLSASVSSASGPAGSPAPGAPKPPVAEKPELAAVASEDTMDSLREHIRNDIASGFYDDEEIQERAVDYLSDETEEAALRPLAAQYLREEWAAHLQAQLDWPELTDCDRLDAAFEELNAAGIVARQNFTCCQTCGNHEIMDEVKAAREQGLKPHGYTFYHMQDTERAVEGAGIYLGFASSSDDAAPVAEEIVATLERHGLRPDWNGSVEKRIFVPLDWKRRR